MTRDERIHAVACAMVRALHPGMRKLRYVEAEAANNQTMLHLATLALDAANATREPTTAEQDIAKARHEALGRIRSVVAEWDTDNESSESMRDIAHVLEETP